MIKEKRPFDTYEEAFEELERIVNTKYNPCKKENIKPCRVYLENGKYFLTSKPKIYDLQ
jgi:hypothetical protein